MLFKTTLHLVAKAQYQTYHVCYRGLNVKVGVSVLLLFETLPDCAQNQTTVFDTLRLLSDF
jgi:hypothetical protein